MMNRKFFWLAVLAILAVFLVPALAKAANYTISSEADMVNFTNSVNGGNTHLGNTFELTGNITLSGNWRPVGDLLLQEFHGTFDGNGYQIEYTTNGYDHTGLFSIIGLNGTVKNLHVKASVSGLYWAGGIAAINRGNITNCSFEGSIDGSNYAGGLAGVSYGTISNCYNKGAASALRAGGIAGASENGIISNCYNAGTINGLKSGGLAGLLVTATLSHSFWLDTSSPNAIGESTDGCLISDTVRFSSDGNLYILIYDQTTLLGALNYHNNIWAASANGYEYPVFKTIAASPSNLDFGGAAAGYDAPCAQTVTITNMGEHPVTLNDLPAPAYFDLGQLSSSTLAVGASATFSVQPKTGLLQGAYGETLILSETDGPTANVYVSFTVTTATIAAASVGGMVVPAPGAMPISLSSLTAQDVGYMVTNLTWQNGDGSAATLVNDKFKAGSAYQAVIELQSNAGYKFPSGGLTPSVSAGTPHAGVVSGGDVSGNKLTFTAAFPNTAALAVTGIAADTQPGVLSYIEGQALNLSGLAVTLTYNDTSTEYVSLGQFGSKGITAAPANGTVLTLIHHGQQVALSLSGQTAYTGALMVVAATYTISVDHANINFDSVIEGYITAPAAQTVTITNAGNKSVTLLTPTNAYYDITALDPLTVAPSGTARFSIQPKAGLAAGTYSETILFGTTSLTSDSVTVSFTVQSLSYAVEADTEILSFSSMIEGYASAPAAQTVTITNTGNKDVTLLTPTNAYYDITALDPLTVAPSGTARFTVQPKAGLAAGSYSENILFSTTSLTSDSVTVSFTVQSASYAIEANPLLVSFQCTAQGEAPPAAQTITVTNTGNKPVTLTQPTAVHYTVGELSALELMPLDTAVFTLAPNTGLMEGSYTETITIEGTNGAAASVQASFSVTQALTYCIAASPLTLAFDSLAEGYLQPEAKTITVTNTGNQSISLYQPTAAYYVIGTLSATALEPGDTAAFTIVPKPDLSAGSYNETVEILGSMGASDQVEVTFPCTEPNEVYEVTDGDGGTFQQDDPAPSNLTFTANGSTQNFTGLTLNGQLVDEDDYDVYEGSTIIVLHQDFLNSLAPGAYTLRFHYTDGHVDAGFVVQDYMPATGDNDALTVFGALSVLCLAALWLLGKKKAAR